MGCGCGSKAAGSEGPFAAKPYRSDVAEREFTDRGDAEMYLAQNGGGRVSPVSATRQEQERSAPIGA